jgi:hypothetical protein
VAAYIVLMLAFVIFASRILRKGPDMEAAVPARTGRALLDIRSAAEAGENPSREVF